jgi:hypothetical protein
MSTQPVTYEGILETIQRITLQQEETSRMFQETDRKFQETSEQMKRTERMFQETREQMKETDKKFQETDKKISALGDRVGEIVEHMIGGDNILIQFQALGYDVTDYSRRIVFGKRGTSMSGEIDMLLDDSDIAILMEVKTTLRNDDVLDHIARLEKYRQWKDSKGEGKKRYIGALACAVVADNVVKFAQKNGMYVIVQLGNTVKIVDSPEGFVAKEW